MTKPPTLSTVGHMLADVAGSVSRFALRQVAKIDRSQQGATAYGAILAVGWLLVLGVTRDNAIGSLIGAGFLGAWAYLRIVLRRRRLRQADRAMLDRVAARGVGQQDAEAEGITIPGRHPIWGWRPDLHDENAAASLWSNTTVGGCRLTWQEIAEIEKARASRLGRLATILLSLDRCEHGRHAGDSCSSGCAGGTSLGNPLTAFLDAMRTEGVEALDTGEGGPLLDAFHRLTAVDRADRLAPHQIGWSLDALPIVVPSRSAAHGDPTSWSPTP